MNYDFFLDLTSSSPILLKEDVRIPADARPLIGNVITLPGSKKQYDVIRSVPTNNPATEKVTYYLLPHEDKLQKDDPQAQVDAFYNSSYT